MATGDVVRQRTVVGERAAAVSQGGVREDVMSVVAALASLRLTVVLFAMAIFLVFMGTLAQKDHDVWAVVHDYFRTPIYKPFKPFAWIEFRTFERLAQVFFRDVNWGLTGSFPFPGGTMIGLALFVNLIAAHALRFRVEAAGRRLTAGLAALAIGVVVTALVIASGMNDTVESELSPAFCNFLWHSLRGALALVAIVGANGLRLAYRRIRRVEWCILLVIELLVGALAVYLLANPSARLDDSGLRLLWQFIKGSAAGLVLLAGAALVFRKPGIVLLHGGVALIMLGELWTALVAQESRMEMQEGETANYSFDLRSSELAVIDRSRTDSDWVTVVPDNLLQAGLKRSRLIEHTDLPFSVRVQRWLPNSEVVKSNEAEQSPATAGAGKFYVGIERPPAVGVGGSNEVDTPSAYVELVEKGSGKPLGTYLVSHWLNEQPVEVDGRSYEIALRFKRTYWPFTLSLMDFKHEVYTGTNTPKDFSSLVQLRDPRHNVDRPYKIWMNNPLRYARTTFYQADWDKVTEKGTKLQVVTNPGWMTPYVGCMLVATGMFAHFGLMLVRFVRRRADADAAEMERLLAGSAAAQATGKGRGNRSVRHQEPPNSQFKFDEPSGGIFSGLAKNWFPIAVVLVFAVYLGSKTRMPQSPDGSMDIYEFGKLPISYQGRIKPYDTLARNTLQLLSSKQELIVKGANGEDTKRPAIEWLLDVISNRKEAQDYPVFRIENLDLLQTLGLEARPGSFRYSLREITQKMSDEKVPAGAGGSAVAPEQRSISELERQISLARAVPEKERTLDQLKVLELARKKIFYDAIFYSFRSPPLSNDMSQLSASVATTRSIIQQLREAESPHAVPPNEASTAWTTLLEAEFVGILSRLQNQPINAATLALGNMLEARFEGDTAAFNKQLAEYRRILAGYEGSLAANADRLKSEGAKPSEIYSRSKVDFEVFFNQFSPFYYCAALYLFAFVLGAASWLIWTGPLLRASNWLIWLTFAVHTFALIARVYISGRPPITNLYSTAIFIGWAVVLLGMVFEAMYRLGLGNIVAAVGGFLTLIVAHYLSLDGDTLIVMQAVLDTQFWLTTHVVCINLGYATTYVAGMLGALYILLAHVFPVLGEKQQRELTRMTYGTLCFAIFFSFIGTVLGGLWGDDSWGRFWGWDPKENGALMIVLYNALVLHARLGGMVKARGLALLTVGGNIVVTWSYFGVNELGEGLHAYGASTSSTGMWLLIFAASQLALIALGAMPKRWFESLGARPLQAS